MKRLLIKLIDIYQNIPLKMHNRCRFIPSCSQYMKEAIIMYGSGKGLYLGIKRIFKCHPFGKYGYDPLKENL